ncbi:MAG: Glycosyltransferase 36, partial [Parcubacteria group bacterium GW2011_GWA2_47_7]
MVRTRLGRSSPHGIERLARNLALFAQLSFDERRAYLFAQKARETIARTRIAYGLLSKNLNERTRSTQGVEVLLDNFYIVEGALMELGASWKHKATLRVPQAPDADGEKQPRVFMITRAFTKEVDALMGRDAITEFLKTYQKNAPLSIRELDIFPDMLRYVLIEELLRQIEWNLAVMKEVATADEWYERIIKTSRRSDALPRLRKLTSLLASEYNIVPQAFGLHLLHRLDQAGKEGDIRMVSKWLKLSLAKQGSTYTQLSTVSAQAERAQAVTISNAITSLRYLAQVRWDKVSLDLNMIDAVLAKDPAEVFQHISDDTRSLYRRTIVRIADRTGAHDIDVAREAVRMARQQYESRHGIVDRRNHVGYYLVDEGVDALKVALGYIPKPTERLRKYIKEHSTSTYLGFVAVTTIILSTLLIALSDTVMLPIAAMLVMVTVGMLLTSEIALALAHFLFTRILEPKPLSALDLKEGVGKGRRTVVVMPSMFRDAVSAEKLLQRMETNFVANNDPDIFYAVLMDFRDAIKQRMPDDEKQVNEIALGVANLNERYPSPTPRFLLFYRERKWSAAENVFMGWERKRGKLREFNQLLRGKETSYIGDVKEAVAPLRSVRYVITLDEDTELVRDGARVLIGTIDHPLNRPVEDKARNIVTQGYGIIQPRAALRFVDGSASTFSHLFGSFPGIDTYSSLISDLHQDLFGDAIFHGKGIYDVDVVESTMSGRIPNDTVLSHDLLEGLYARVGIASGAHIFEGFPSNYREHAKRLHRWIRGDWQIIGWIFRPRGAIFSPIARFRIFDNLRRSTLPIAALLAIVFSAFSQADESAWTIAALLALGSGQLVSAILHITERTVDWRRSTRLLVSKKKLLEWQTAYDAAAEKKNSVLGFTRFMWVSVCGSLFLVYLEFHGGHVDEILPVVWIFSWAAAPFFASIISVELRRDYQPTADERLYLHKIAARTYWFFLDIATAEEQWLAPDHLQEEPPSKRHSHGLGVSPTNLGMYLLSLSGATTLGLSSVSSCSERMGKAFDSIDKMERYKGHFFNWYELKGLTPLAPQYISSVDSANLALSLIAVRGALTEACNIPIINIAMFEGLRAKLAVLLESCEYSMQHADA